MVKSEISQLSQVLNHGDKKAVLSEMKKLFGLAYPTRYFQLIQKTYAVIVKLYDGKFKGYKKCNTEYHNLSHTIDAFVASLRILDGYNLVEKKIKVETAVNLMLAALLHDTGYIQEVEDNIGTGAKYTRNHVDRSIQFIEVNKKKLGLKTEQVLSISRLISCTGLKVKLDEIDFSDREEETAGAILGTADLIGQMADRSYLEKLLFLYYEFREAGIDGYESEFDILKNTLNFYETTKDRLNFFFKRIYDYCQYHFQKRFAVDENLYMEAITRQMSYLEEVIQDETINFRHKLRRMNLQQYEMKVLEKVLMEEQPIMINLKDPTVQIH